MLISFPGLRPRSTTCLKQVTCIHIQEPSPSGSRRDESLHNSLILPVTSAGTFENPSVKRDWCAFPGLCPANRRWSHSVLCQGLLHHQYMSFSRIWTPSPHSLKKTTYHSFVPDFPLLVDETSPFYTKTAKLNRVFWNAVLILCIISNYCYLHYHCTPRRAQDGWAKQGKYCSPCCMSSSSWFWRWML